MFIKQNRSSFFFLKYFFKRKLAVIVQAPEFLYLSVPALWVLKSATNFSEQLLSCELEMITAITSKLHFQD